ncbi:helicase-associated domain-containing protein [Candidatus Woesearchaeota archaeon]|nr:helicase-associated domain-containing protein [Candidatus Woesearchaeota archaeon]
MGKLLVVQTDSTITFSGPDTHLRVKTTLERFSEWESGDGAVGIYRISSQSLARAANSGMMGEEVLAFLEKHSSGVPQNVEFEVDAQLKGLPRVTLKQDGLEFVLMSEDPNVLRMIRTDIARYVSSPTHKDGVSLVPRQCKRAKDRLIERGYLIRDEVGEENYPTVSLESLEKKLELPAEVIGAIEGIHVYDGYVADNEELKTRIREYEGATFEKMKKFRSFLPAEHQTSLNWRFPSMKGYRSWTGTKRMGKALGFLDFVATHDFLAEAGGRDIFQFLQHGYPHLNENEFLAILQGLGKEYSKKKSVAECYCLPEEVVERLPGIVWTMLGKDTYAEDGRSLQDAVAVFESEVGKKMRQWKAFLPKENREKLEERYTAAGDDRRQTYFRRGEHLKCLSLLEIIASHDFKKLAGNLT